MLLVRSKKQNKINKARITERTKRTDGQKDIACSFYNVYLLRRSLSDSRPYIISLPRRLCQSVSVHKFYASVYYNDFPSLVVSLVYRRYLVMSSSSFLHAAIASPICRGRLNSPICFQRRRFPILLCAKRPDVALYAIGRLFLFPTPSSTPRTLYVSEHDSLWQPPAVHADERPAPKMLSHFFCTPVLPRARTFIFSILQQG